MVKLKKKWKDKWVKALRSGEYEQGIGQLKESAYTTFSGKPEYCCLGVLCDVTGVRFKGTSAEPPHKVADLVFTKKSLAANPPVEDWKVGVYAKLAKFNDENMWTFKRIANWIEKNL